MIQSCSKLVEHTVVCYDVDGELTLEHARWLRGAIGRRIERPEFHHHLGQGLLYQHPQIRYHVSANRAVILGLADGAVLLRSLPDWESVQLGSRDYRILKSTRQDYRLELGPTDVPIIYRFQTPYLALNQQNHGQWERSDPFVRRRLLERVVVGNLLSLAKSVRLDVTVRLCAEVELSPSGWFELKPGVRLLGFEGAIRVNFNLPQWWGLGKSSARGFGTLARQEV